MELRLGVRLCGTHRLKALPCGNTLPAGCCARGRSISMVVLHPPCSQSPGARREAEGVSGDATGCTLSKHSAPERRRRESGFIKSTAVGSD
ncbi:hypothetical protein EYF80_006355 [Liparis tanakae]|uniref:Uncharacterized protein n=1 Tax=Liparis tanakae TaxID=230148 RepID=A0A4Z2J0N5_9TELE|nr:hypothetical protein EYF80_006355 [Liparis tanakae]